MLNINTSMISKAFSIFVAALPIISIYASPVPGMNFAEFLLCLFWGAAIVTRRLRSVSLSRTALLIIAFVAYLYVSFMVATLDTTGDNAAIIRLLRFSLYYVSAVVLGNCYFSLDTFSVWVKRISYTSLLFLFFQYTSYYLLGRVLNGMIPGLPVYLKDYTELDYAGIFARHFFRPTSIFLEPAHFAQYMFVALTLALWKTHSRLWALSISVGLLFSTSGQGIIIGTLIWVFYYTTMTLTLWKRKEVKLADIAFCVLCIIAAVVAMRSDVFANSLNRLMQNGTSGASYARLSGYSAVFSEMKGLKAIIGYGFGNVPEGAWLPGLAYVWYGSGVIGVCFLLAFSICVGVKTSKQCQTMVIVFLATLFESSVFMNTMVIVYLCYILCLVGGTTECQTEYSS